MKFIFWVSFWLILCLVLILIPSFVARIISFFLFFGGLLFLLSGLGIVPANPHHKTVVTIWGKRQKIRVKGIIEEEEERVEKETEIARTKNEGIRFFPRRPLWYNGILVNVAKRNYDLPPQKVRTPDLAESGIPISITYSPDSDYLIEYLNAGGQTGVENIIKGIYSRKIKGLGYKS